MKQPCIYIDRDTKTVDRGEGKTMSYTREHVLRGHWDGEKAELYETYDPRKMKTTVYDKTKLIFVNQ